MGFIRVPKYLNKETKKGSQTRALAKSKKLVEQLKNAKRNQGRAYKPSEAKAVAKVMQRASSTVDVPRQVKTSPSAFGNALVKPFDRGSFGCRVPDPYSFPTVTHHYHSTFTLNAFAANNGKIGCAFLPNPVFSMVDTLAFSTGSVANTNIVAAGAAYNNFGAATAGTAFYGMGTLNDLSRAYSSYRVVSTGIKISNLQPELNATGRLFIAQVPLSDTMPSAADLTYGSLTNQISPSIFGLTAGVLASGTLLQLPTCREFVVQDLLQGDIIECPMITNPIFFAFKSPQAGGSLGAYTFGDDVQQNVIGGSVVTSFKDPTRCKGGSAIIIYGEGFPTSANAPMIQIEQIMHLEGSPVLSTSSSPYMVPSNLPVSLSGSTELVEAGIRFLAKHAIQYVAHNSAFLNGFAI